MKLRLFIYGAVIAFFGISCSSTQTNSQQLQIVATTGMVADLVQNIAKDSAVVSALMGPGVDPHLYKATHGDLVKLQEADIIFYNGLHLEGKMGEIFESLSKVKTVIAISDNIPQELLLSDPKYPDSPDPHIWFDANLWSLTIPLVVETLSNADTENTEYYAMNGQIYREKLNELHKFHQEEIQRIQPEKRILITAHDAFHYYGNAYGIQVRGLQGISTLSEFGLKDRVDLVNYIVSEGIPAVFVETSVAEKNILAIVEGCKQKGHIIRIGGSLFSDAMGEQGTPEGTYIGMAKANTKTIVQGLSDEEDS